MKVFPVSYSLFWGLALGDKSAKATESNGRDGLLLSFLLSIILCLRIVSNNRKEIFHV